MNPVLKKMYHPIVAVTEIGLAGPTSLSLFFSLRWEPCHCLQTAPSYPIEPDRSTNATVIVNIAVRLPSLSLFPRFAAAVPSDQVFPVSSPQLTHEK